MTLLSWWSGLSLVGKILTVGSVWFASGIPVAGWLAWHRVGDHDSPWERRKLRQRRALARIELEPRPAVWADRDENGREWR